MSSNALRYPAVLAMLFLLLLLHSCAPAEQPISKAEAGKIATIIESSIAGGNSKMLDNILNIDVFARRIATNTHIKIDANAKEGLKAGLEKRSLGREIITSAGKGGSYRLLRQYEQDGRQHLLFRLYGDQGINYHDFELIKTGKEIKAADILIYFSGEKLSQTIGDFIGGMSNEKQAEASVNSVKQIRRLMDTHEYRAAKEAYDNLPPETRQKKLMLMLNIQISSDLGDNDGYLKAIEEYRTHYPDAPNVPLLMIDAYFLNNDYSKALDAVDKLDKLVGSDPLLDYYRGLVYKMKNDTAQYTKYIGQAYAYDPSLQDLTLEIINVYLMNQAHDKTDEAIRAYRANKSFNQVLFEEWLHAKNYP